MAFNIYIRVQLDGLIGQILLREGGVMFAFRFYVLILFFLATVIWEKIKYKPENEPNYHSDFID